MQKKCASASTSKEFRRLVSKIAAEDAAHHHMPDYAVTLDEDDMVTFVNRGTIKELESASIDHASVLTLRSQTYDEARQAAPGWDVYGLEQEWRSWMTEPPRNPDAAFIGFCRKWFERRGMPN